MRLTLRKKTLFFVTVALIVMTIAAYLLIQT